MSADSSGDDLADSLQDYLDRARRANSEAALGHHFLTFVQETFDTLESDQANRMLPYLEEYVNIEEGTVAISGRVDARIGNVLVEFKTDLDRDLSDAKQQLRRYITAI